MDGGQWPRRAWIPGQVPVTSGGEWGGEPVLWGQHPAPARLPPCHLRVSDQGLGLPSRLQDGALWDGPCQPRGWLATPFSGGGQRAGARALRWELRAAPASGPHVAGGSGAPPAAAPHFMPLLLGLAFHFLNSLCRKHSHCSAFGKIFKLIIRPLKERGLHCPLVELTKRL